MGKGGQFREYEDHDATGLAELVRKGEVSAEELLEEALARVEALNPKINAIADLREDVARRSIREGLPDGPLTGVPFLFKDAAASRAKDFPGCCGSALLKGTVHEANSNIVDRMLRTGVAVFGRTTSPEGAVGAVTEAAVYGGPTRNPWNLDRTPGGSSGGSGAAVASGILPAAHGSDGGGSIRIPASSCGLFGFKGTRARLPDGPFAGEGWAGMSIEGFLTRTVRDQATLLDAVEGPDLGAPYHAPPLECPFSEAAQRDPGRLKVAFMTTNFAGGPIHPENAKAVRAAAKMLEDLGHEVSEDSPDADIGMMMAAWTDIVACGTALWIDRALEGKGRALEPGDVEPTIASAYRYAKTLNGPRYLHAVNQVHLYGRQLAAFFGRHDVLLTSTLAEPPCEIGRLDHTWEDFVEYRCGKGGVFDYSPFTAAYNAGGQPAASLPLHWTGDGLPVGVQLGARTGDDSRLMSLCAQVERAHPWFGRRAPLRWRAG